MEFVVVNDSGKDITPTAISIEGAQLTDSLYAYRTEPCTCVGKGGVERKRHTHRARIPVGMAPELWEAVLADRVKHAKYLHAKWTARCVARHVQTFVRTGRWMGDEITGHVTNAKDALMLLSAENRFGQVLNGYGVAPEHHDFCYALTAELAVKKLGAQK